MLTLRMVLETVPSVQPVRIYNEANPCKPIIDLTDLDSFNTANEFLDNEVYLIHSAVYDNIDYIVISIK